MKRLFSLLFILFTILLSNPGFSIGPLDIMDRYTGTRAQAMGGAFVAVADDSSAPYWNPAGLSQILYPQISTTYVNLYGMTDRFSFDSIYLLDRYQTIFAFNFIQEGMQNIPKTVDVGGNGIQIGSFDEYKRAANVSFGKDLGNKLSCGMNARFIFNTLDTEYANGWSSDAGVLWKYSKNISYGLVLRNIASKLEWSTGKTEIFDKQLIAGTAYQDIIMEIPCIFTLDLEANPFNKYKWYAGSEYWLAPNIFAFRTGTNSDKRWTFGLGLIYSNFICDFCYWKEEFLGEQYLLSFGYDFGPPLRSRFQGTKTNASDKVSPLYTELYPGDPLVITVKNSKNEFAKAAVSFPEYDLIKNMDKKQDTFKLTHKPTVTPELGKTQQAKVYLQAHDGTVFVEQIEYKYIPNPAQPEIVLSKTIWKKGETLIIQLIVGKENKINTALVEFDEYNTIEMKKVAEGLYEARYVLSPKLKSGTYSARVLAKIDYQPIFNKTITFKVID